MCMLWLGRKELKEIEYVSRKRIGKLNMDSNEIASMVSELNELLNTAERVQSEASDKVDEITTIRDALEESNSKLGDAVGALEEVATIVEEVEGLLNDAEEHDIT